MDTDLFPTFSVIIPAHNEADVVERSIASVREQVYPKETELIVACNGCTDDTPAIARRSGARVFESDTMGMSFGKNLGGREAKGELLLFLDADSRLLPGSLAEIAQAVRNHAQAVGTVTAFLDQPTAFEAFAMRQVNRIQRLRKLPTPSGAIFIHRSLYEAIGGFDEAIPQGTSSDISMRAMDAGGAWVFAREAGAITSPRRFRKVGFFRQAFSWVRNVRLLRQKRLDTLSRREYKNIR